MLNTTTSHTEQARRHTPSETVHVLSGHNHGDPLTALTLEIAISAYVLGDQPFAVCDDMPAIPPIDRLVPAGASATHRWQRFNRTQLVVKGPGWTAHLSLGLGEHLDITVTGETIAVADEALVSIKALVRTPPPKDATVEMNLWYASDQSIGVRREIREIATPPWQRIAPNYPPRVASALSSLAAMSPPAGTGRLVLWHGEPGTGKTTAIRALAHEWKEWTQVHYVMDAERFFNRPDYMYRVLVDDVSSASRKWALLVIEDADRFLVSNARDKAGAGLSRLLNLTDGIVGQGLNVIVLLTTNEPLGRLHPAVVRPGRCIAKVEFGRFDAAGARAWLGFDPPTSPDGATLAELYELSGDEQRILEDAPAKSGGLYL